MSDGVIVVLDDGTMEEWDEYALQRRGIPSWAREATLAESRDYRIRRALEKRIDDLEARVRALESPPTRTER